MSSRRDFLKHAGSMGIGFGLGPALASCLQGRAEASDIAGTQAVKAGKAQHLTILHTSDIHGQIEIHDEFFYERGRPAFRRRGGFATLRTMINALRRQNPAHTLVVDGGDCFQGSAVAALSKGQPTDRARRGLHPRGGEADITIEYLWSMLRVESAIKTGVVSGQQIVDWLESELDNVFAKEAARPTGSGDLAFHRPRQPSIRSLDFRDVQCFSPWRLWAWSSRTRGSSIRLRLPGSPASQRCWSSGSQSGARSRPASGD